MLDNPLKVDAFKLKGRLFTFTVLELHCIHAAAFLSELQRVVKQVPKLFTHAPVVLDLSPLKGASFDLKGIVDAMRSVKMVAVAIQGASVVQQKSAIACGLAVITSSAKKDLERVSQIQSEQVNNDNDANTLRINDPVTKVAKDKNVSANSAESVDHSTQKTHTEKTPAVKEKARPSKVITAPVRSGQQIYAKGCDLVIIGSVGRGAEVLADGHIHVYGSLRGRALAGIQGDQNARIFCQALDAELVSIAGQYKLSESFNPHLQKGPKQLLLKDGHISIDSL